MRVNDVNVRIFILPACLPVEMDWLNCLVVLLRVICQILLAIVYMLTVSLSVSLSFSISLYLYSVYDILKEDCEFAGPRPRATWLT